MGLLTRVIPSSVFPSPILPENSYGIGVFPHPFGLFTPREWVNSPTINLYHGLCKVSHKNSWILSGEERTIVIRLIGCKLAYML